MGIDISKPSLPLVTAADCKDVANDEIKKTYYQGKGIESELKCYDGQPNYFALFDRNGEKTLSQSFDRQGAVKATNIFENGASRTIYRKF